ncbi:hypothetical protein OPV22_018523 [Ensete ventricosum]|uniref:FAS1 domain-containing protein n=1 Tax=Ensete ventricosum TaxID=4639 RepID=A0AAV8QYU7_ENSVE|nr:hypothetical protein OPV22_018523 [Ensete ventricosum]
MQRALPLLAASLLMSAAATAPVAQGHNITKILAEHPEFSTFNHYLTVTHLATEINCRLTITVLVVGNSGIADLLARHLSLLTLRNVLSLHILTDYYGAKKLHQLTGGSTLASSVFQSSGHAPGTTGYINITDHRAGKVTFSVEDDGCAPPVDFVKSVEEMPYNISVLQVSTILSSPEAEAPVAAPAPVNLTELMSKKGCKAFADLLLARPGILQTFQDNLDSGLTVFCPAIELLKSHNGVVNTLATDGSNKNFNYTVQNDGTDVTLKTRVVTATITSTLIDQDPDAVYAVDKVLEPRELFKVAEVVDAPVPAPAGSKKSKHASPPAPAGPEEPPADQATADHSALSVHILCARSI